MITRRTFLGASALAAGVQAQARRANIVMILCDDLGYGDLGCFGNRIIQTPYLDRLAASGVRFTDFYAGSTVCTPTRAALMTGHHPQRYGIHHADLPESLPRYPLPASAVTIAEVLRGAGYHTAHVGKWHLGEPPESVTPREQGFDYFFGCFGGRPSSPWIKFARSMDPEIVVNENRPAVYKGHVTDVQTAAALDVLDRAPRDRPFFLNLWYNAPHEPLAALDHQAKLYRDWSPEEQTYFQTVTDMDAGVGRVLAKLEQIGAAQNTLIVFCSDNGPEVHRNRFSRGSAGPLKGMKTQLWEGGIRVPGILNWSGRVPPGVVSHAPVSVLDAFPTFCAAAGIPVPANVKLDGGANLVPIARGERDVSGRALFFEFHFPQRGVASSLPMVVRRGRWKLFGTHDLARVELYDLAADIGEGRDVASQNPGIVRDLRAELKKWWSQFDGKVDLGLKPTRVAVPSEEELDKRHYRN